MMKLGIVGSGKIVIECLQAIQSIDAISCTAICVREHSRDKAQALADEYHIPAIFTDYAEFLADADIDILYIGIVNSEHYAYSLQALQAGRHVICEKPFTSTCQELETLVELAKRQNLFLFEAITSISGRIWRRWVISNWCSAIIPNIPVAMISIWLGRYSLRSIPRCPAVHCMISMCTTSILSLRCLGVRSTCIISPIPDSMALIPRVW